MVGFEPREALEARRSLGGLAGGYERGVQRVGRELEEGFRDESEDESESEGDGRGRGRGVR